jgi:hypothetical protein
VKFDDNPNCNGEFLDAFEVRNDKIIHHPWIDNGTVYFGMAIIEGKAILKTFSNFDCEQDKSPDTTYTIPIHSSADTIHFTIQL